MTLIYRKPQPITALSQWADSVQRTYRPSRDEQDDPWLQPFDVMGVIMVNMLFGLWANLPLLFLGAYARSDNILEITTDVIAELGVRKIATATAGRMMSAGTVRAAGQQAGLPVERVSKVAVLATSALEAEIEVFFERVEVEMRRLTGPAERPDL